MTTTRPIRLTFGLLAVMAAATVLGPALAASDLDAGIKAVEAGKAKQAIPLLSGVLTSGASGPDLARAYYYRGLANQQMKQHTQAIADLSNALWLKGLSEEERREALYRRGVSYQAVGMADRAAKDFEGAGKSPDTAATSATASAATSPTKQVAAAAKPAATDTATAAPASGGATVASGWTTDVVAASGAGASATETPPSNSGGLTLFGNGGLFGNLFSGGTSGVPAASASYAAQDGGSNAIAEGSGGTIAWAAPAGSAGAIQAQTQPIRRSSSTSDGAAPATSAAVKQSQIALAAAAEDTTATAGTGWGTQVVTDEPSGQSGGAAQPGGLAGLFSGIFGGGQQSGAGDIETASTSPAGSTAAAAPAGQASAAAGQTGWSVPDAETGTSYRLQLASLRSAEEAAAYVSDLRVKQAELLQSYRAQVDESVLGNMGTFYNVRLGPFPDERTSLKVCNRLQRDGIDCFLVVN